MGSTVGKSLSVSYFIAAALLVVFGFSIRQDLPTDGALQIALGVVMLGAGLFLRGGTSQSWVVGVMAAGVVCLYGAYDLVTGNGYVPGTIVAVFAFARLMSAQAHFRPGAAGAPAGQPMPYGAPTGYPQQPYPAAAYPPAAYPQPAYPEVGYPQAAYPEVGYPQAAYPQAAYPQAAYPTPPVAAPPPAAAPVQPPRQPQPPADPRFG